MPDALPALHRGSLDADGFDAYIADLRACAEEVHVQFRARSGPRPGAGAASVSGAGAGAAAGAEAEHASLETLAAWLSAGDANAAQVRYEHDGVGWCDTLRTAGSTIDIVRIQQI